MAALGWIDFLRKVGNRFDRLDFFVVCLLDGFSLLRTITLERAPGPAMGGGGGGGATGGGGMPGCIIPPGGMPPSSIIFCSLTRTAPCL